MCESGRHTTEAGRAGGLLVTVSFGVGLLSH